MPPIAEIRTSISSERTIEFPTRPAMKTQAGIGVAARRASAAVLAGERHRHDEGLHRRRDDRQREDRRHVVGRRADDAGR
jgi:hypothetical protein